MPYLIDGHNLIGKVPTIELSDLDDEQHLIQLLQDFCQRTGQKVDVFFDNAPAGGAPVRVFGLVTARFIRSGKTADAAIENRLRVLDRSARNYTVVSSDQRVLAAAKAAHARPLSSEDFTALLFHAPDKANPNPRNNPPPPSESEISEWLDLFGGEES